MKAKSLYIQKLAYDENTGNEIIGLFPSEANPAIVSSYTYDAKRMGGAPTLTATIYSSEPLQWKKEEFVEYNGDRFFASYTPNSTKDNSSRMWKSEITFTSRRELLDNTLFFDVVVDDVDTQNKDRYRSNQTKFTFGGTIHEFVARINSSMAYCGLYRPTEEYKGYYVVVDEGYGTDEVKEVSFEDQYLTDVLQLINTTFELDYYWDGNVCHVGKVQHDLTDTPIKYGCSDALISVSKENANYKIVDMITGYGSSDNLPYYYPNDDEFGEAVFNTENISKDKVSVELSKFLKDSRYNDTLVLYKSKDEKNYNGSVDVSSKAFDRFTTPSNLTQADSQSNPTVTCSFSFDILINAIKGETIDLTSLGFDFEINSSVSRKDYITNVGDAIKNIYLFKGKELYKTISKRMSIGSTSTYTFKEDGDFILSIEVEFSYKCKVYKNSAGINDFYGADSWNVSFSGSVEFLYESKSEYEWKNGDKYIPYSDAGINVSVIGEANCIEYDYQFFKDDNRYGFNKVYSGTDDNATKVVVTDRVWIAPSSVLMPSIYRNTKGAERFFYALNNTHKLPSGSGYYEFVNLYKKGNPHQGTVTFDDIKPTINGIVNAEGQLFGEIADVAFDKEDSDVKDSDGKYIHNYFYIKLHKFNGDFGFDLFAHALASESAKINLIKSNGCPACSFTIGCYWNSEKNKCYNNVLTDGNGNLKSDSGKMNSKGDYILNDTYVEDNKSNQDSTKEELWICVQKDTSTLGIVMPNASAGFKPQKGDLFVITGIKPPKVLVMAAEKRLDDALVKHMSENNTDQFNYSVKFSRIFLQENPDFASKLNENAKLSIQIQGDSDCDGNLISHEVFVSNYSVKVDTDELAEVEIELVNSLEVTKSDTKQIIDAVKGEAVKSLSSMVGGSNTNSFNASITDKMYLSKLNDDTAKGTITWEKVQKLLSGLLIGEEFSFDKDGNILAHSISSDGASEENGKGFTILQKDPLTNTYKLCIDEVIAYTVATVGKLFVNGNSRFGGELSSKQFISGFLGGLGWGIYNTPVTNAAGVQENKWTGEFDNVIVRGSLRVFEMVVSQLLGENDNRIFTGMLEVDHYDAASGKVYLDTKDGTMYNPFRKDDYIMVQQYNGEPSEGNNYYVTKGYELIVTEVGSEGTGKDMLAWVKFRDFATTMEGATAESLIKKKDTFVRVDNISDSQRKGIIQLMTVGANTPYMDIIYGMKTDPNNALKGRLGNLKGIVHPILGELSGFGEFLNNLYAVGDFIIQRTGESVDSKLQVLENMFSSRFSQTSYELTNSDNYLENGQFLEQVRDDEDTIISCWAVDSTDDSMFWADALGNPFMVNGLLSVSGNRKVSIDKVDGRQVLRLQNCGVKQLNAHIRQPGTHKEYQQPSGSTGDNGLKKPATGSTDVQDRLYISIRIFAKTAGTLTIGFEGCSSVSGKSNTLTAQNIAVPYSGDWTNIPLEGVWNGTGDFVLRYTGDCYIAIASITEKPLSEFSKSVSTQIKQTATNIQLLGENIDNVNGTTTRLGLELDAEKGEIRQYVDKSLYGEKGVLEQAKSEIKQTADSITSTVEKNKKDADGQFASVKTSIKQNADDITSTVSAVNANSTSISQIRQDVGKISLAVAKNKKDSDTKYSQIDITVSGITAITSKLHFDNAGNVTNISTAGLVTTDSYAGLFAENVKNSQLATKGEVSVKIGEDEAKKLISIATIQADQINLTGHTMAFTGGQITITTDNFTLDGSGNMWCQNGTFSGTVKGVHGSFKNLDCVDIKGNVVGSIQFGTDGRLTFSGDMNHQGYDNDKKRGWRFYAADIWCRGMFGHRQKTVAIISDTIMRIYTKESAFEDSTFVMKYLEKKTATDGKTYWNVPLYLYAADGDASGMPIDVIVFVCHSDDYYVFTEMGMGKEWRVINGNDKQTVHFADIGGWHELKGGASLSCVYIGPSNLSPKPTSLGAGVFWSGEYDLNWS